MKALACPYCGTKVTAENVGEFHLAWGSYQGDMFDPAVVCVGRSGRGCYLRHEDVIRSLESGANLADCTMPVTSESVARIAQTYRTSGRLHAPRLREIARLCASLGAA